MKTDLPESTSRTSVDMVSPLFSSTAGMVDAKLPSKLSIISLLHTLSTFSAVCTILVGGVVLFGWFFDIEIPNSATHFGTIQANVTLLVILIALLAANATLLYQLESQRRLADKVRQDTNQRSTEILERVTDAFAALDREHRFVYVNGRATQMTRRSTEDLLGKTLGQAFPGIDQLPGWEELERAWAEQVPIDFESYCPSLGIWMEMRIYPSQGGTTMYVADITGRKQAEQERSLLQTLTLVIAEAEDIESALNVTLGNVCEATGWTMGQVWLPSADGKQLECGRAHYYKLKRLEEFRQCSVARPMRMGEGLPGRVWAAKKSIWIRNVQDDDNFPRGPVAAKVGLKSAFAIPVLAGEDVLAVMEFFTLQSRPEDQCLLDLVSGIAAQIGTVLRRKQAEALVFRLNQTLQHRITELQTLLDVIPVGIAIAEDSEGKRIKVNPALARMLGLPGAVHGSFVVSGEDSHAFKFSRNGSELSADQHPINAALRGVEMRGVELDVVLDDGKTLNLLAYAGPLLGEDGRCRGGVGAFLDITERKHLEEQFRQAQKMEAIGRLAGGVAHDFNNLLTVITGYSEILLGQTREGDGVFEPVKEIKAAGDRATGLTRQLLAFSRKQVLDPKVLDLNGLILNMEKMLKRLIGEDIRLLTSTNPELWRVKADPGQMEQVIMNLAVNARDAMPRGGQLIFMTSNVQLDERFLTTYPDAQPGPYVMLAISDTGCGMDTATKARIFEPFFTTKGRDKGTGLGLATVYGIIKQSGGHIDLYSEPGIGTTFTIYLPRNEAEVVTLRSLGSTSSIAHGSERVLLVEDEDNVRTLARLVLENHGYTVLEARHGGEALSLCENQKDKISLLVTDVVMPNMSGCQLAERLTALRPDLKVLYLSGYNDSDIIHHGALDAKTHFLHKPFSAESLAQTVRQILDLGAPENGRVPEIAEGRASQTVG